jgi:hypothetical protein
MYICIHSQWLKINACLIKKLCVVCFSYKKKKMPKIVKKDCKYINCTIKRCKGKIKLGSKLDGLLVVDSAVCFTCALGSTGICVKKYRAREMLPDVSKFAVQGKKLSRQTVAKFDGSIMANGCSASPKKAGLNHTHTHKNSIANIAHGFSFSQKIAASSSSSSCSSSDEQSEGSDGPACVELDENKHNSDDGNNDDVQNAAPPPAKKSRGGNPENTISATNYRLDEAFDQKVKNIV